MTQFEARYEAGTLSASQNALRVLKPTVLAVAMGCVGSAWAADGGVVVNGTGRIATQGATTTVTQSTDKMVVNWNNFDIAQGQTVNFAQPNASSAVLNRVVGPVKATDIQGTLNANGRVYVGDVATMGQMRETLDAANAYTDSRMDDVWKDLGNEINQVNRQANRGIAAASALINVTPYVPGHTTVNAGMASYRGEAALGIGVSRWSDNGRVNLNAGVSAAKDDEPVFRVGVGYIF